MRYGSLHGNVLGMEMVLADGRVIDSLSTLRKDNTGYDLKQLFIGGEGTLGVVSKLSILAARKPKCQLVAMLGCASYEHVLRAMQQARSELLEIVSAIEFLDRESLELVVKHIPSQFSDWSDDARAVQLHPLGARVSNITGESHTHVLLLALSFDCSFFSFLQTRATLFRRPTPSTCSSKHQARMRRTTRRSDFSLRTARLGLARDASRIRFGLFTRRSTAAHTVSVLRPRFFCADLCV